jgi:hypothetical protein
MDPQPGVTVQQNPDAGIAEGRQSAPRRPHLQFLEQALSSGNKPGARLWTNACNARRRMLTSVPALPDHPQLIHGPSVAKDPASSAPACERCRRDFRQCRRRAQPGPGSRFAPAAQRLPSPKECQSERGIRAVRRGGQHLDEPGTGDGSLSRSSVRRRASIVALWEGRWHWGALARSRRRHRGSILPLEGAAGPRQMLRAGQTLRDRPSLRERHSLHGRRRKERIARTGRPWPWANSFGTSAEGGC